MSKYSYITNADPAYVDALYKQYLAEPESVDYGWQKFFEGFEFARKAPGEIGTVDRSTLKEINVLNLIHGYRQRGHLFTRTNPVRERRKYTPTLDLENFGLSESDLDTVFQAGNEIGIGPAPLRKIIEHLQTTYCRSIGAEYIFIRQPEKLKWLQTRMESTRNLPNFSETDKRHILYKLTRAVLFENFLHRKFVGQKRFALSGGETLIPGLDAIVETGAELGIEEFVIGMAHRGRLNVLANILEKPIEHIFAEFADTEPADFVYAGDVKYHLGYSNDVRTRKGKVVHLSLSPNPSHLEAVDPVVEGLMRAKLDHRYRGDLTKIAPILIHGDAAIAAQGVVYEVIQMSLLKGYATGGTIHLVINNQVGFTTNYLEGRSSTYCTDVAKVTLSPVFHVNADDVEAVVFAIQMAMEYRQTFHTDVFIDLLGYRRYGHNEADEPRYTQPKLYKIISTHPEPHTIYLNELKKLDPGYESVSKQFEEEIQAELETKFQKAKHIKKLNLNSFLEGDWSGFRFARKQDFLQTPRTGLREEKLLSLGDKIFTIPEDIRVFSKIRRMFNEHRKRLLDEHLADWTIGEWLAYASLLDEGVPIRLSGQDSVRGTFSHRHAVLLVEDTEEPYTPLNHIREGQARFEIYNSPLSEYGVLGFEFGYAWANPRGLTIWEAQFGDFANGAQIVIDQFLCAAEVKWQKMNGLVLYLPHGYEGQGPEHSSARIERFLILSADNNWQVVNCTTPANFFHVLRRQTKFPFRKPLIIITPKSLLRHPRCVSKLEEFTAERFQEVIDDPVGDPAKVRRVLICSGKLYYELLQRKEEGQHEDVAIVRLEQLYPFPEEQLRTVLSRYGRAREFFWVQEEPENMGAGFFILKHLNWLPLQMISRPENATTATGYYKQHLLEQKKIIDRAFSAQSSLRRSARKSLKQSGTQTEGKRK